ncbi:FlgD immunoglobulin-like domain containing protein [Candidatus Neomarinimicrobiota bacterium]
MNRLFFSGSFVLFLLTSNQFVFAAGSAVAASVQVKQDLVLSRTSGTTRTNTTVGNQYVNVFADDLSGQFTIGTADGRRLTYGYPSPGSTSHTNFMLISGGDTTYYSNEFISGATNLDADTSYMTPDSAIVHIFHIGDVVITQRLTPVGGEGVGSIWIQYELSNNSQNEVAVGVLLEIDTDIYGNDAAPLYTSYGAVTVETGFTAPGVPTYWQAFEDPAYDPAYLIGQGILSGPGAVSPDYFVCGNWGYLYDVLWDYTPNGLEYYDSAVLYRWNPIALSTGTSTTVGTYYGTGEATVSSGQLTAVLSAPSELGIDNGNLSPNPFEVNLVVQNTGDVDAINVQATIHLPPGLSLAAGDSTALATPATITPLAVGTASWSVLAADVSADTTYEITVDISASDAPSNSVNRSITVPHIDLTYEPEILAITDVPEDQGGWVYVQWAPSGLDGQGNLATYGLWERNPDGEWISVRTTPATGASGYLAFAHTFADSSSNGIYWSAFKITAHAPDATYYASPVDSGYSVDNKAPMIPASLVASAGSPGTIQLSWGVPVDADFAFFRIYRGATSSFHASAESLVEELVDATFTDTGLQTGATVYYRVSAVDVNGNESEVSPPVSADVLAIAGASALPVTFALRPNYPNPFNPGTTVQFAFPEAAEGLIVVYDLTGREVARLLNRRLEAGYHSVMWDGTDRRGIPVSAGVYIVRLVTSEYVASMRITLVK